MILKQTFELNSIKAIRDENLLPESYKIYINDQQIGIIKLWGGTIVADCYNSTIFKNEIRKGASQFDHDDERFFYIEEILKMINEIANIRGII